MLSEFISDEDVDDCDLISTSFRRHSLSISWGFSVEVPTSWQFWPRACMRVLWPRIKFCHWDIQNLCSQIKWITIWIQNVLHIISSRPIQVCVKLDARNTHTCIILNPIKCYSHFFLYSKFLVVSFLFSPCFLKVNLNFFFLSLTHER